MHDYMNAVNENNNKNKPAYLIRPAIRTFFIVLIISFIAFLALKDHITFAQFMWIPVAFVGIVCTYNNTLAEVRQVACIQAITGLIGIIAGFLLARNYDFRAINLADALSECILQVIVIIVEVVLGILFYFLYKVKKKCRLNVEQGVSFNENELLPSRRYDLKELEKQFYRVSIIGIDGSWGSGKTFLVNQLIEKCRCKAEIETVRVGLFGLSSEDVIRNVFYQLDNILRKHGIVSGHSRAINHIVSGSRFFSSVQSAIFPDYSSIDDSIENMHTMLQSLPCVIVLVIEDIDRVDKRDANKVRSIMALCDKLAGGNVKCIVEYDSEKLKEVDSQFDFSFIEKYVSYSMTLSNITLREGMETLVNGKKDSLYDEVNELVQHSRFEFNFLANQFDFSYQRDTDDIFIPSVRLLEKFIEEADRELSDDYYNDPVKRKAIIGLLYIKYFDNDTFVHFHRGHKPDQVMYIEIQGQKYTIPDLKVKAKQYEGKRAPKEFVDGFKEALITEDNSDYKDDTYSYVGTIQKMEDYYLLGYKPDLESEYKKDSSRRNPYWAKVRYENSEIDRVIWHYLEKGVSEYTDEEVMQKKVSRILKEESHDNWKKDFEKLYADMFAGAGHLYKDAVTVQKMGESFDSAAVKALSIAGADKDTWKKLLGYIGEQTAGEQLNDSKISIMSRCCLSDRRSTFMPAIKMFIKWKSDADYTDNREYIKFIAYYLDSFVEMQYVDGQYHELHDLIYTDNSMDFVKEMIRSALDEYKTSACKREHEYRSRGMNSVADDMKDIVVFLQKNIDIFNSKVKPEHTPNVNIKFSSASQRNMKNNLFEKLHNDGSDEEIDKAYKNGDIDMTDLQKLKK